jgi:hypothetical protein
MGIHVAVLGRALAIALTQIGCIDTAAFAHGTIGNVQVLSESTDSAVLEIAYAYDGAHGEGASATVRVVRDGERLSGFPAARGAVGSGQGRTLVELAMHSNPPAPVVSNGLQLSLVGRDGAVFATKRVAFAKTWTTARTSLQEIAEAVAIPRPRQPILLPDPSSGQAGSISGGPAGGGAGGQPVQRRILSGGAVEQRYPDGTVVRLSPGGKSVTKPDGSKQVYAYSNAQSPTLPRAPPGDALAAWIDGEAARLLSIMQVLVGFDQASMTAYLQTEAGLTPYGRVSQRTRTIDLLVQE